MARKKLLLFRIGLDQGGADRVTVTLLRHLDRAKFEVHLALMKTDGPLMEEIPDDVVVHKLKCRSLWDAWVPLVPLLRRLRPDIVFSTSSGTNVPATIAHELSRSRSRLVLSERNVLFHGPTTAKRVLQVALKAGLYRRADAVTAVSGGVRDDLRRKLRLNGTPPVDVVFNPVVEDTIDARAAERVEHPLFDGSHEVVLSVGRLVPQKDHRTMLEAFERIRRARHAARLAILGDGPLRGEIEREVERRGLGGAVELLGFQSNPFAYMARASVYVLHSTEEGLPGALIQAMACGAPAVSTDCPSGPSEIIERPGVDGFLVKVGDAPAIARHVVELLEDDERRRAVAEAGRTAARRFSLAESLPLYERALLGEAA